VVYDPSTNVTKEQAIREVKEGDLVRTLSVTAVRGMGMGTGMGTGRGAGRGAGTIPEEKFTRVLFAMVKRNEEVDFTRVVLSGDSGGVRLSVTSDHGLLVVEDDEQESEGLRESGSGTGLRLYRADSVKVGWKVKCSDGSLRRVEAVQEEKRSERASVGTAMGTLLANGALVSTICGSEFEDGAALEEVLPRWQQSHGASAWPAESEGHIVTHKE
jgi:hypothetical protein